MGSVYSHMSKEATIPEGRRRLAAVVREAGDIVQIADAERALDVSRTVAAKLLSRWSGQGWLRRVGPGAYAPVSLDSLVSEQVLDDPWVLVPVLYDPAYIGGRTAAEHWDLTEQIFRDIVVMTERPVRAGSQERHGASFTLRHVRAGMMFGTRSVWRGRTRIAVSDVHRTIIDMLDDPEVGAGIQHVDDHHARSLATVLHPISVARTGTMENWSPTLIGLATVPYSSAWASWQNAGPGAALFSTHAESG